MQRRYEVAIIFCLFAVLSMGTLADEKSAPPGNVILIGWDGTQRNHLKECLARGETPNLKRLASEGNLVAIDVLRVTDTKAGWSQILTGYNPEVTGVFSNGNYQPIPKGYTIFERLEKYFGSENIITVAVIGKKGHVDDDPPQKIRVVDDEGDAPRKTPKQPQGKKKAAKVASMPAKLKKNAQPQEGKIVEKNGVRYRIIPGKPYYRTREGMDVFINGLIKDDVVGSKTLELLTKYKDKPFFFFVHFAQVDHSGHAHGENSKEYNDAIKSGDFWLGKIVAKLKELNLYDRTYIYVTADHGFDEGKGSHMDAPYVFLATNDPGVMRRGFREDIAPTILERFGLDLLKIKPPLDGHPLTKSYTPPVW